jgi:hypothetical protein
MGEAGNDDAAIDDRVVALLWALQEMHLHIEALLGGERISAVTIARAMARSDEVMAALLTSGADGAAPSTGKKCGGAGGPCPTPGGMP